MLRAIMLNATFLSTYDHAKHQMINRGIMNDGLLNNFVSSVISGICIACVTAPIDLIKTRIQN